MNTTEILVHGNNGNKNQIFSETAKKGKKICEFVEDIITNLLVHICVLS